VALLVGQGSRFVPLPKLVIEKQRYKKDCE
jgi:hypothetical protein